jgi:hypothetical protein
LLLASKDGRADFAQRDLQNPNSLRQPPGKLKTSSRQPWKLAAKKYLGLDRQCPTLLFMLGSLDN